MLQSLKRETSSCDQHRINSIKEWLSLSQSLKRETSSCDALSSHGSHTLSLCCNRSSAKPLHATQGMGTPTGFSHACCNRSSAKPLHATEREKQAAEDMKMVAIAQARN